MKCIKEQSENNELVTGSVAHLAFSAPPN